MEGIHLNNDICEITCVHEEKVSRAKMSLSEIDTLTLSSIFKVLADENRFKIIHALIGEEELCVCDVATIIEATLATTSHHLKSLKKLGVTTSRKEGKMVYYSIEDTRIAELMTTGLTLQGQVSS